MRTGGILLGMLGALLPFLVPVWIAPAPQEVAESATDPASGHTYLRTPDPLSVHEAEALARELGGHLVSIGSAEEETFLLDNFGAEEGYWIGLELPREAWSDGTAVVYAHWAAGEPSGGSAEVFTVMNWGEPGAWGDAAGDVETERWRALVELPAGVPPPERVPDAPAGPPTNRGVLLCAIQGLQPKDLESSRNRVLNDFWKGSAWTYDAGADLSEDPLAGLGLVLWGIGSERSRLFSSDPGRAARGPENLLSRLERARAGVATAALVDDPALAGILLDGRMDLRASNASPRRGGTLQPVRDALARPAPLCVVAAWTSLAVPGAQEPPESSRTKELAAIDAELGAVLEALRARPGFAGEEWLVVVTGIAPVHGKKPPAPGERARTGVPLCLVAPGVEPGPLAGDVLLADLVPTALAHLGVEPRRSYALDGRALPLGATPPLGANLVVNGGAEAQLGWSSGALAQLTAWRQLVPLGRGRYASDEPVPPDGGQSYFQGAGGALARAEQTVDLRALATDIDRGSLRRRFAAWIGAEGGAALTCTLELLDERGKVLARVALPEDADEKGPVATSGALGRYESAGKLPRRTRAARIVLAATGGDVRRARADGIELVLERVD